MPDRAPANLSQLPQNDRVQWLISMETCSSARSTPVTTTIPIMSVPHESLCCTRSLTPLTPVSDFLSASAIITERCRPPVQPTATVR